MFFLLYIACVTREAFPEAYGAANCDAIERCGLGWSSSAEEGESCEEWYARVNTLDEYLPESGWDARLAAACVEEVRDMDCDDPQPRLACEELFGL